MRRTGRHAAFRGTVARARRFRRTRRGLLLSAAVAVVAAAATAGGAWAGFTSQSPAADLSVSAGTLDLGVQARYGTGTASSFDVTDARPGLHLRDYVLTLTNRGTLTGRLSLYAVLTPASVPSAVPVTPSPTVDSGDPGNSDAARHRTPSPTPSPYPSGSRPNPDAVLRHDVLVTVVADGLTVSTDVPLATLATHPVVIGPLAPHAQTKVVLRMRIASDADPTVRQGTVQLAFQASLDQVDAPTPAPTTT